MKVLVVEDQKDHQEILERLLNKSPYSFDVLFHATIEGLLDKIELLNPDILFLDIELPDGRTIEHIDAILEACLKPPKIIFVTSFEDYAIQAFRLSAIDYIVKPLTESLFSRALEKALGAYNFDEELKKLQVLSANIRSPKNKTLIIKNAEAIHLKNADDIIYCFAESNYTIFVFQSNERLRVAIPLKEYDDALSSFGFLRIHRSHLININHITKVSLSFNEVTMINGDILEVSKGRKDQVKKSLSSI
ncbi:MAG: LytTR family DNA-binding domain-containing protein [Flavobacteriales bacterium]|nr:LytTR family DNA-binding domain-containing protein [Flavobacteriales bacterium]